MSHFFHIVLVRGDETTSHAYIEETVTRLMKPFDENTDVEPYKAYSDADDIRLMAEHYGQTDLVYLAGHMDDWSGCVGGVDENGLYRLSTYNPRSKWDWWSYGGRWNGVMRHQPRDSAEDGGFNWDDEFRQLPENMALVKRMDHKVTCHSILTPDGIWHEQGRGGWWGIVHDPKEEELWYAEVLDILAAHSDCIAVGVDFHI